MRIKWNRHHKLTVNSIWEFIHIFIICLITVDLAMAVAVAMTEADNFLFSVFWFRVYLHLASKSIFEWKITHFYHWMKLIWLHRQIYRYWLKICVCGITEWLKSLLFFYFKLWSLEMHIRMYVSNKWKCDTCI